MFVLKKRRIKSMPLKRPLYFYIFEEGGRLKAVNEEFDIIVEGDSISEVDDKLDTMILTILALHSGPVDKMKLDYIVKYLKGYAGVVGNVQGS